MKYKKPYRTGPVQLKDGFYIEVAEESGGRSMKIRSDSKKAMEDSAVLYGNYKTVTILGEYRGGIPVSS